MQTEKENHHQHIYQLHIQIQKIPKFRWKMEIQRIKRSLDPQQRSPGRQFFAVSTLDRSLVIKELVIVGNVIVKSSSYLHNIVAIINWSTA